MNKTVLGILGFLLLAPGLVLLGMGGIIVGPLLCAVGGALLVLAIKPEMFKRYFIIVTMLLVIGATALGLGVWFLKGYASEPHIHTLF